MPLNRRISVDLQRTPVAPGEAEPKHHYQPTSEYHPTMIPVKCAKCGAVGIAEFRGGFNIKDGDRLQSGRAITGLCCGCGQRTHLVPIKLSKEERKELYLEHGVRDALAGHVKRGIPIQGDTLIPEGKQKERFDADSGTGGQPGESGS